MKDPVAPYHIKYTKNCQVPKEGHLGQFPANFCVKLKGTNGNITMLQSCPSKEINWKVLQIRFQKKGFGLSKFKAKCTTIHFRFTNPF